MSVHNENPFAEMWRTIRIIAKGRSREQIMLGRFTLWQITHRQDSEMRQLNKQSRREIREALGKLWPGNWGKRRGN